MSGGNGVPEAGKLAAQIAAIDRARCIAAQTVKDLEDIRNRLVVEVDQVLSAAEKVLRAINIAREGLLVHQERLA